MNTGSELKSQFGKLTNIARTGVAYSFPIKLLFSALLPVIAGTGFLAYFTDYATYLYAAKLGIRIPLEGLQYLKASVTLASFLLLVTCAAIFALLTFLAKTFSVLIILIDSYTRPEKVSGASLQETSPPQQEETAQEEGRKLEKFAARFKTFWHADIREFGTIQRIVACVVSMLLTMGIGWVSTKMFPSINNGYIDVVATCALFGFLATCSFAFPWTIWFISFSFTAAWFLLCLSFLVNTKKYEWFLSTIGYGGKISITLHKKADSTLPELSKARTLLLLRTNEYFVVLDQAQNQVLEIPRNEIHYVSYPAVRLDNPRVPVLP